MTSKDIPAILLKVKTMCTPWSDFVIHTPGIRTHTLGNKEWNYLHPNISWGYLKVMGLQRILIFFFMVILIFTINENSEYYIL